MRDSSQAVPACTSQAWTVDNELAFLDRLGSWSISGAARKKCLDGYAKALKAGRIGFSWSDLLRIRVKVHSLMLAEGMNPPGALQ